MKNCLILFFLLHWSSLGFAYQSKDFEWLNEIPTIRILYSNPQGMGHAAAALNVMRRLRELGFRNELDVATHESLDFEDQSLTFLAPWARFDGQERLQSPLGHVRFTRNIQIKSNGDHKPRNLTIKNAKRVVLTLAPGWDYNIEDHHDYNSEFFMLMGPKGWGKNHCLVSGVRALEEICEDEAFHNMPYKYFVPRPNSIGDFLVNEMPGDKRAGALAYLLGRKSNYNIMPAYGLASDGHGYSGLHRVARIAKIVRLVSGTSRFSKPSVILVLHEQFDKKMEEEVRGKLPNDGTFLFADAIDRSVSSLIASLKTGQVLILKVGAVPQPIFHFLMTLNSLPPTTFGANATGLLVQNGLPALPSGVSFFKYLPPPKNALEEQAIEQIKWYAQSMDFSIYIPDETKHYKFPPGANSYDEAVAKHILEATDPTTQVGRYFKSLKSNEDKLTYILNRLKPHILASKQRCQECQ